MKKGSKWFVKLPIELIRDKELISTDLRVYAEIRTYFHERNFVAAFPSRTRIASNIGCKTDTVDRSIKRLILRGYITREKGKRGHSNRYYFPDNLCEDGRTEAPTIAAPMQSSTGIEAVNVPAPMRHQGEFYNKNYKQKVSLSLFHGKDPCSVKTDGTINIRTHLGTWPIYAGGDDAIFRFGALRGIEAKKAAIAHFCGDKSDYVSPSASDYATD